LSTRASRSGLNSFAILGLGRIVEGASACRDRIVYAEVGYPLQRVQFVRAQARVPVPLKATSVSTAHGGWRHTCPQIRLAAGNSTRRSYVFTEAGSGRDREEVPLTLDGLQLVHAAILSVEEIFSVGNPLSARRAQGTLLPAHGAQSPAVLTLFPHGMDAVLHLVLHTGCAGRHQPSASLDLLLCHIALDAKPRRNDAG
jgi:hypothetical protein